MILSLAKRYVWILNVILGGLLLHSIIFYIMKDERKIWALPPEEKGNYQISTLNSEGFLRSRKAYDVIVEKNIFRGARKTPQPARDLLLADFSKTKLNLILLGTISGRDSSTAIIKNPVTGEIKTYVEGDAINLINAEELRLVRVSKCMAMIERKDRYETLGCGTGNSVSRPYSKPSIETSNVFSPIARYKIMNTSEDKSKSNYEEEILRASKKHGVDPDLVKAVIKVESNFNPNAISSKNAMGIMQLMPETAKDYRVNDMFDPRDNIDGGVRVLRDLMDYFNNNLALSLAAYNAGKGTVIKYGFRVPPYIETMDYISRVLGHYALLKWNRYEKEK